MIATGIFCKLRFFKIFSKLLNLSIMNSNLFLYSLFISFENDSTKLSRSIEITFVFFLDNIFLVMLPPPKIQSIYSPDLLRVNILSMSSYITGICLNSSDMGKFYL